jgi:hypothetical protein
MLRYTYIACLVGTELVVILTMDVFKLKVSFKWAMTFCVYKMHHMRVSFFSFKYTVFHFLHIYSSIYLFICLYV